MQPPLPEEIAQMSDSETACKYCGISYLLLNKYEKMRAHVADVDAQFLALQEYVNERPTLLSRLEILQNQQREQTTVVGDLTRQIDTLRDSVAVGERRFRDLEGELSKYRQLLVFMCHLYRINLKGLGELKTKSTWRKISNANNTRHKFNSNYNNTDQISKITNHYTKTSL